MLTEKELSLSPGLITKRDEVKAALLFPLPSFLSYLLKGR